MTLSMGCLHMMVVGGEYWAKIGESGEKTYLERILCFKPMKVWRNKRNCFFMNENARMRNLN